MFKPNVSDPLVMDRGQDTYSIATLMTSVTSAAMYTDIAAMAIHDPLKPGRYVGHENESESGPQRACPARETQLELKQSLRTVSMFWIDSRPQLFKRWIALSTG